MAKHKSWHAIRTQVDAIRYEIEHNGRRRAQYSRSQIKQLEVALYTLEWALGRHSNHTPVHFVGEPRSG